MVIANRFQNMIPIVVGSPMMYITGCSDTGCLDADNHNSSDELSEFSITPDTSVHMTHDGLPQTQAVSCNRVPRAQSKGKDLTLLMKPGICYQTPAESLYFREKVMACQKNTPLGNPRKSDLEAKQQRAQLPSYLPKKGPRTKTTPQKIQPPKNKLRKLVNSTNKAAK